LTIGNTTGAIGGAGASSPFIILGFLLDAFLNDQKRRQNFEVDH